MSCGGKKLVVELPCPLFGVQCGSFQFFGKILEPAFISKFKYSATSKTNLACTWTFGPFNLNSSVAIVDCRMRSKGESCPICKPESPQ